MQLILGTSRICHPGRKAVLRHCGCHAHKRHLGFSTSRALRPSQLLRASSSSAATAADGSGSKASQDPAEPKPNPLQRLLQWISTVCPKAESGHLLKDTFSLLKNYWWAFLILFLARDAFQFVLHRVTHRVTNWAAESIFEYPISSMVINPWWLVLDAEFLEQHSGYQLMMVFFFLIALPLNLLLNCGSKALMMLLCTKQSRAQAAQQQSSSTSADNPPPTTQDEIPPASLPSSLIPPPTQTPSYTAGFTPPSTTPNVPPPTPPSPNASLSDGHSSASPTPSTSTNGSSTSSTEPSISNTEPSISKNGSSSSSKVTPGTNGSALSTAPSSSKSGVAAAAASPAASNGGTAPVNTSSTTSDSTSTTSNSSSITSNSASNSTSTSSSSSTSGHVSSSGEASPGSSGADSPHKTGGSVQPEDSPSQPEVPASSDPSSPSQATASTSSVSPTPTSSSPPATSPAPTSSSSDGPAAAAGAVTTASTGEGKSRASPTNRSPVVVSPPPHKPIKGPRHAMAEMKSVMSDVWSIMGRIWCVELLASTASLGLQGLMALVIPVIWALPWLLSIQLALAASIFKGHKGLEALRQSHSLMQGYRTAYFWPFFLLLVATRLVDTLRAGAFALMPNRYWTDAIEIPILVYVLIALMGFMLSRLQDILPLAAFLRVSAAKPEREEDSSGGEQEEGTKTAAVAA